MLLHFPEPKVAFYEIEFCLATDKKNFLWIHEEGTVQSG